MDFTSKKTLDFLKKLVDLEVGLSKKLIKSIEVKEKTLEYQLGMIWHIKEVKKHERDMIINILNF